MEVRQLFNPFKKQDSQYQKYLETEQEVKKDLSELSVIVQNILNDVRYQRFTQLVKQAEENTIELCLQLHKQKLENRYNKYDEFLTELGVYRNILKSVSDLANPKIQEKKNMVNSFKGRIQDLLNNII